MCSVSPPVRSRNMCNMTHAGLTAFAALCDLEIEEAAQLLRVGATLGLPSEILICLGAMAPTVIETQRQLIMRGIISRPGELIPV